MSSGFSPPRMRRKPAACSNALAPEAAAPRAARARDRNGPLCRRGGRRCSWPASRRRPATYDSSFTDAVLTSTPDAVDAALDDVVERASSSVGWCTSCWYWPTPIDFGSIFTSSASGSCSRRPIDTAPRTVTSWSGNSSRATSRRRVDRRARLVDHDDLARRRAVLAWPACARTLSVSRPAVPLPIGDRLDAMLLAQRSDGRLGLVEPPLRLRRIDHRRAPAGCRSRRSTATLQPVRKPGSMRQHAACRRAAPRAAGCAGSRRRPGSPRASARSLS